MIYSFCIINKQVVTFTGPESVIYCIRICTIIMSFYIKSDIYITIRIRYSLYSGRRMVFSNSEIERLCSTLLNIMRIICMPFIREECNMREICISRCRIN